MPVFCRSIRHNVWSCSSALTSEILFEYRYSSFRRWSGLSSEMSVIKLLPSERISSCFRFYKPSRLESLFPFRYSFLTSLVVLRVSTFFIALNLRDSSVSYDKF